MTPTLRLRDSRGMTVLEVMIALVVVAVGLLAMISSMISSSNLASASSEDVEAIVFAQNKVEEMKAADPAQLLATYGPTGGVDLTQLVAHVGQGGNKEATWFTDGSSVCAVSSALTGTPTAWSGNAYTATPALPTGIAGTAQDPHGVQSGWYPPVALPGEALYRIDRKATCTIHFLTEQEFQAQTGLTCINSSFYGTSGAADQIDISATRTGSPATTVTTNYSFYPVRVTVSWIPRDSRDGSTQTRSVSILTCIYPGPGTAQTPTRAQ